MKLIETKEVIDSLMTLHHQYAVTSRPSHLYPIHHIYIMTVNTSHVSGVKCNIASGELIKLKLLR